MLSKVYEIFSIQQNFHGTALSFICILKTSSNHSPWSGKKFHQSRGDFLRRFRWQPVPVVRVVNHFLRAKTLREGRSDVRVAVSPKDACGNALRESQQSFFPAF